MKYRIIGNMTGNSMDAIDIVLTEFEGENFRDICTYTKPYCKNIQRQMDELRKQVFNKTRSEIEDLPDFKSIHDDYIQEIAECINEMCEKNNIDKTTINAIGFHGKTLDHNPPSRAKLNQSKPYTLQMGSGQRLADLTGIPVVYDVRSDFIMEGFEGAPLMAPHNLHISKIEGDGVYYNGGNSSNFAIISKGKILINTDAGPFNEYIDGYVRLCCDMMYDENGNIGRKGKLNKKLLQKIFDIGRDFYELTLPKSGDPAYYYKKEIFDYIKTENIKLEDAIYTFEYSAAYIAVYTLSFVDNIEIPENFILFGGGWKNPIVFENFEKLLKGTGFILPEHQDLFNNLYRRVSVNPVIRFSQFGDYMEARLMADLAQYKLENKPWNIPEVVIAGKSIVCGRIAYPQKVSNKYDDYLNRAGKGW